MSINFKIASRFMKSNKAQTTLISLGIALGVAVQIFLGLLINNLNDNLLNKTIGSSSQITITSENKEDKLIKDYGNIIEDIKSNEGNTITDLLTILDTPALVNNGDSNESILVRGLNYSEDNDIYDIKNKITEGEFPTNNGDVLIGKGVSDSLNLNIGDEFTLITSNNNETLVKVYGIVDMQVKALNDSWVLTSLESAQNLFNQDNSITTIEMKIDMDKIFDADAIAANISTYIPENLNITNWKEDNGSLLDALSGQKSSSLTIQVFIIISVTMSIAGVLAISVLQKSKQIGILKAMGIKNKAAASIFLLQGLIFGVIGTTIGTALGITLFKIFNIVVKTSDGSPLVPGNMYFGFIAISALLSIASSIIAAGVAARKSLKLDPMDIIRNN
ncbi:Lipoprotein-releasing system transmembrane protein lolE [uncultured Clostridium sp.]|uniref:ABC transporter permease n=1 Tax=uncultured Clostridium sp. TaxID=59620 RepID=UPI00082340E9|nr:FtsX-like permease family protein [uncultured Clostridium sp.]SCJ37924.1 Lipoprotein-releasing system transmembrane protein lolE [uncultured Clostridium sp.]